MELWEGKPTRAIEGPPYACNRGAAGCLFCVCLLLLSFVAFFLEEGQRVNVPKSKAPKSLSLSCYYGLFCLRLMCGVLMRIG